MVVVKYMLAEYERLLLTELDNPDYFHQIHACLKECNAFMSLVYKSGLFLRGRRLSRVVLHGKAMLAAYSSCASRAHAQGLARFKYNPKFHYFCHIIYDLECSSVARKPGLNPIATSCQMPEDFINKCATLSRQVHSKVVSSSTLDLYKHAVATAWRD